MEAFPPGTRSHSGLSAEPSGEVIRIGESQPESRSADRAAPGEFPFRGSQQFPGPPLSQSEPRPPAHEPVEVILLEAHPACQFSRCGHGLRRQDDPGQSPRDRGPLCSGLSGAGAGPSAGIQDQESRAPCAELERERGLSLAFPFVGQLVEAFTHLRQLLGWKPSRPGPESVRSGACEVRHQTDRQTRGVLQKGVLGTRGNEENRPRPDRMTLRSDDLLPLAA